ncbi:MAG: SDR family oxidoreductase [Pseudomonadota bacterium]
MTEFQDAVVIVTGASRGIGAATATAFADQGARVVLAARSAHDIAVHAAAIRERGGKAIAVATDVADYASVTALMDQTVTEFGGIDVLVNNAGLIRPIVHLAESDPDAWVTAANANYVGIYYALRQTLPHMLAAGSGTIVNISSGAATSALEGWSHYCSSKAAALMLTKCVHKEYADRGIRCIGLSPGTVATDMQVAIKASGINPVSQLDPSAHIPPEWVAKAIVWCASDAARPHDGDDVRLRDPDIRSAIGL